MKILLTGGTGFIARTLGPKLVSAGHELTIVSRSGARARGQAPFPCKIIEADLEKSVLNFSEIQDIEAVIHLSGEGIADVRWTAARKKKILESRTIGTQNLINSFKNSQHLKTFVGASAIGIYGDQGEKDCTESTQPGSGFLSEVTEAWEKAYDNVPSKLRLVKLRIGVVLGRMGGAFEQMLFPFQLGIGAPLGSGRQWMSWIHIQDLVSAIVWSLENSKASGVYNCVAENPVRNKEFSQKLSKNLNKNIFPAVPGFAIKLLYGEMASLILGSTKVLPERLVKEGFKFQYSFCGEALSELCEPYKNGDWLFETTQYFSKPTDAVFPFFADAKNLEKITPPLLNFKIMSMSTPEIQEGTLIDYKLKIRGFPISWRTKILNWNPNQEFSDMALKGPYSKWHHTHTFSKMGSGTFMTDRVLYKLPIGMLGELAAGIMVKSDVKKIFEYRRKITDEELF